MPLGPHRPAQLSSAPPAFQSAKPAPPILPSLYSNQPGGSITFSRFVPGFPLTALYNGTTGLPDVSFNICYLAIVIFPNGTIPITVPSIFNISLRVNIQVSYKKVCARLRQSAVNQTYFLRIGLNPLINSSYEYSFVSGTVTFAIGPGSDGPQNVWGGTFRVKVVPPFITAPLASLKLRVDSG